MRLEKLEIKGFKSFANDTVINFQEEVIGIVGPNGSGKSNIVDAIRWVLGEQKSKELRLDQMSSVIFNGTSKRKPAGIAQVSLTFENTRNILPTEFQKVTVSRVLYRSGESEYRLNGVPCRLKDITTLFMDTGIGSNSYAIIALGMVDDILNDKDNARRNMFEQAAGVSKYKMRKRETLQKLKSTTEDLDRVEDLLFEINANLDALEKQAKRTRKFFELKDQYKSLSLSLAYLKISVLKAEQEGLRQHLEKEEDAFRSTEIALNGMEAKLEQVRKENLDRERVLSDQQRVLNQLVGAIRSRESDKKVLEQRLQFVEQNRATLDKQITKGQDTIEQLTEDLTFLRSSLNFEKHREFELEEALDKAEQALANIRTNHGALKSDLDATLGTQQVLERDLLQLEKQRAVKANQVVNKKNEQEKGLADLNARALELSATQDRLTRLMGEEAVSQSGLNQLEAEEAARSEQLKGDQASMEALRATLNQVNRSLDAHKNEFQLTKSMVDSLEGFPESIKFLKKNIEWSANEAPLLSDLLYVEERYRTAIENFLEPFLNYYVVPDRETAVLAVELLQKSQKGKANFFILDQLKELASSGTVPASAGIPALGVVQFETTYRQLFAFLLHEVYIVPDPKVVPVEQILPGSVFIAEKGDLVLGSQHLSGGSVGLFEGKKIGRKKNLEVLGAQIQEEEAEAKALSAELNRIQLGIALLQQQDLSASIRQSQLQLQKLVQERVYLETKLDNFKQFNASVEKNLEQIAMELLVLEQEITATQLALDQQQSLLAGVKEKFAKADSVYRNASDQLSAASAVFNDKNIAFIKQQSKVSAVQQECTFKEKQLREAKELLDANRTQLGQSAVELEKISEEAAQLEASLSQDYAKRQEQEAHVVAFEEAYFDLREQLNSLEDELRKKNKIRNDAQLAINNLKDKYTQAKFEVTAVAQRLRIEFDTDVNELLRENLELEDSADELQLKVERMKSRLDNYGEINPMAVQAYDEMKLRYDMIAQQRTDILEAKDSLLETIKEIEETATMQFLEAFEKARMYFINVFRSLFTADDNCDLILLDPDNPLESKIEIIAKPKGKRPQTINQLSGGEKTLTATALLFALYLLKPAPFCIFDEVDAPLDDHNIAKFNKIIKKFSKDSQFIIVTHNKLTMAAVDTIYGVYMPEQGVSSVTQVDFRDFEHSGVFEAAAV
jgi:chromosome segregation protein